MKIYESGSHIVCSVVSYLLVGANIEAYERQSLIYMFAALIQIALGY